MTVHRVASADAGRRALEVLSALGARRVVSAITGVAMGIMPALHAGGLDLAPWPTAVGFDPLYDIDVGVTGVEAAIAETGTLVCWSTVVCGRGLSLVPPVHLAVVCRSDLVPDLIDYFARHAREPYVTLPSSIVLITGPSKTADIEGVLITGVHGPREVHILLIEDA
jgi:L-lactate dehydrogenase complex protein LldG